MTAFADCLLIKYMLKTRLCPLRRDNIRVRCDSAEERYSREKKYTFAAYGGAFNRSGCFVLCRRLFKKESRSEAKRTDLA